MKNFLLSLLCLSIFVLTGCSDDDEPVYYYQNVPAIVKYQNQQPYLETPGNLFAASGLSDTLKSGDCLWSSFVVDMNGQPNPNVPQVSSLYYRKLGKDSVRAATGNMLDDYNSFITEAVLYTSYVDSVLFFEFYISGMTDNVPVNRVEYPSSPNYAFEIMYNTDSMMVVNGMNIPKLYIKAKQLSTQAPTSVRYRFAFDMAEFVTKYADTATKSVPLYLHYKTGTTGTSDGDIYKSFKTYPVNWKP